MKPFQYRTKQKVLAERQEMKRERDEEKRIMIHMNIQDDSTFLSPFSPSRTPIISEEVAGFIEHCTQTIPPNEPLTLCLHSNCIDDQEKIIDEQGIREYYKMKYMTNHRELKQNRLIALLLGLVGTLVLIWEVIFDYHNGNVIWTEIIDIVAWVLLWESVDISLLENRQKKIKEKYYLNYLEMKILFFDE